MRMLVSVCALLSACSGPSDAQIAALNEGRNAIAGCQERFHEQSRTYADCVRYVAQQSGRIDESAAPLAEWRAMGALQSGWVSADLVGQQGDEDAEDAAHILLVEATSMQARINLTDARLCALLKQSCETLANRRKDLLRRPATGATVSQPSTQPKPL